MNNELYKNKYRIASTRLQNWGNLWATTYFISICLQNRKHHFDNTVHCGIIKQFKQNHSNKRI